MRQYFVNIWQGFTTPLTGMRLTWRRLFKPSVTLQYPEERWELPSNSRMQLFVNMDDCIGCAQCERACPVRCITIETIKAGIQIVRNPVLVSFVPKLELPYRGLGSGIPRMIEECRKANLPEPELIEDKIAETFTVVFHRPTD